MATSKGYQLIEIAYCRNEGCPWRGLSLFAEEHANLCNYREIICSSCKCKIQKGHYYNHLFLFCKNRMDISCCDEWSGDLCPRSHLGCMWRGTPAMFLKYHKAQCNRQKIPCSVCDLDCFKGELALHVLNECPLRCRHVPGTFGNGVTTFNKPSWVKEKIRTSAFTMQYDELTDPEFQDK